MVSFALEYAVYSILALLVLAIFFYFLYRQYILFLLEDVNSSASAQNEKRNRWYDFLTPQIPGKIRHLKHDREHKIAEQKHHGFFMQFGLEKSKVNNRIFNRIKRIAKHQGAEKVFRNLEEVNKAVEKNQKKITEKNEIRNSISKLKEMFGRG